MMWGAVIDDVVVVKLTSSSVCVPYRCRWRQKKKTKRVNFG